MKRLPFLLLLLAGCVQPPLWEKESAQKIEPIVAVFMNRSNDYTVFVKDGDELKPEYLYGPEPGHVKILADVPEGKPMYALRTRFINKGGGTTHRDKGKTEIELHIRSEKDLSGGMWSERTGGKHPKTIEGKVNRITP